MNGTVTSKRIVKEATRAFLAIVMLGSLSTPAFAQFTTLRQPLIDGQPNAAPFEVPAIGDPPPIGSGDVPPMVTPGMFGPPDLPPSDLYVPPVMGGDKDSVNAAVSGYLTPPPSTPGADPGNINGSSGGYGLQAPVGTGNIDAGGGISFSAPTTRWAAQRSTDYGRNQNRVNQNASGLADFGERLPDKPDLKMMPQFSQDGPRPLYQAALGQPIRGSSALTNAQATTDLYGNRTNFNAQYHSQMTIAPY
ncbi:MAG: hypothetical protein KGS72_02935 [Cyanobacteria bacterium REEB67]|nr:hypothetical protein [Cyanobacteria bacterium REEB67]